MAYATIKPAIILRLMKVHDLALVYHSVGPKELVGIAEVIKTAYPDPTAKTGDWSAVDVKFKMRLKKPVTLAEIKATPSLKNLKLVTQGRLSVSMVPESQWHILIKMAQTKLEIPKNPHHSGALIPQITSVAILIKKPMRHQAPKLT